MKIYFDDVLINEDSYVELTNEYKLFNDSFYLGSVASNTFNLKILKSEVSNHPTNIKIDDDITTFHLIVDKVEEDKGFYNYSLVDKMIDFNFNYDAKVLIDEKTALEEECYLSDILEDMCLQAGVELDYVLTNDIVVSWYDNRIQAREYISFIAELEGGYACINELGKLTIKQHKQASKKTISADEVSELIVGERKLITRVVYDNGIVKYEFGDDTGNTLYLNQNNVFIKNETVVENIYNKIFDFEFYTITVPNTLIDSSIKAGDVITFVDGEKEYQTMAQYSSSYAGGWTGSYDFNINTEKQEETKIVGISESVKRIASEFDREKNRITLLAEEIEKLTDYIRNVGTTGSYLKLPDTPRSNGAINKLSIKGFDLRELYPGMAYPSEYTYPGVLNFYTLIFDTVNTFNNNPHYVYVNSPIPLQKLGSVFDELLIEANKATVIQRIGYDFVNEQWSVLSTPITHELNDVLLPTFEDNTYIKVLYFDNLIFNAEYLIKNDLTSNFATQLESKSQFKINQDEITSKVSKDNLISEINQTSEQVRITANKIKFEGVVTANENFKILDDGSMEAKNGTFSGDIYLGEGKVLSEAGLMTNLNFNSEGMFFGNFASNIGWFVNYPNQEKARLAIYYYLPSNFQVVEARILLSHNCIAWYDNTTFIGNGYSRDIRVYKKSPNSSFSVFGTVGGGGDIDTSSITGTEIVNAFGSPYTPTQQASGIIENKSTVDIKDHIEEGRNVLYLETGEGTPATLNEGALKTGEVRATLQIIGYMKFDI